MSEAIEKNELKSMFIDHCVGLVDYWVNCEQEGAMTVRDKVEGVVFSVLTAIDGNSGGFPCGLDLVARPHPDDKQFHINEDEDYIEDGQIINDNVNLHEEFLHAVRKGNI